MADKMNIETFTLHSCACCESKLVFVSGVKVDDKIKPMSEICASSDYIPIEGFNFCKSCMVEHCVTTDCISCLFRHREELLDSDGGCIFLADKNHYMSCEDDTE